MVTGVPYIPLPLNIEEDVRWLLKDPVGSRYRVQGREQEQVRYEHECFACYRSIEVVAMPCPAYPPCYLSSGSAPIQGYIMRNPSPPPQQKDCLAVLVRHPYRCVCPCLEIAYNAVVIGTRRSGPSSSSEDASTGTFMPNAAGEGTLSPDAPGRTGYGSCHPHPLPFPATRHVLPMPRHHHHHLRRIPPYRAAGPSPPPGAVPFPPGRSSCHGKARASPQSHPAPGC